MTPAAPDQHILNAGLHSQQSRGPRYARLNVIDAGVNSWYNGLVTQFQKRMSHGLTGSVHILGHHTMTMARAAPARPTFSPAAVRKATFPANYSHEKEAHLDLRHRVGIGFVWAPTLLHNNNAGRQILANNWHSPCLERSRRHLQ